MPEQTLNTKPNPTRTPDSTADRLDALLIELTSAYDRLDEIADARQRAISSADLAALSNTVRDENEIIQRVAQLDAERASIVRDLAQEPRLDPATTTLSQLAHRVADPARDALLDGARRLRTLIEKVQMKNAATRMAAEKLARHMQGLLRTAEGWHSHSGAYGRSGAVRAGAAVVTALDCTT